MAGDRKPLLMLQFMFGESAETSQRAVSDRLLTWAEAFDEWLAELGAKYTKSTTKQAKLAWRRLLNERGGRFPWALGEEDIQAHAEWMVKEGYAASTTANALGYISKFYRWCDDRRIDPEVVPPRGGSKPLDRRSRSEPFDRKSKSEPFDRKSKSEPFDGKSRSEPFDGKSKSKPFDVKSKSEPFNPAAGVKRPKVERYAGAALLSEGEVERLLGVLRRDESALGKRDYAFILARARLGVPLKAIQRLRWGQVREETDEGGNHVRVLRPGKNIQDITPGEHRSVPPGGGSKHFAPGEHQSVPPGGGSKHFDFGLRPPLSMPSVRGGAQVRWREEGEFVELAEEVWAAMLDHLAAAGRLEGMATEDYIFAPLAEPGTAKDNDKAEDWLGGQYVSYSAIRASLKLYGRLVAIPEERLTMKSLRRTATRRELETGRSTAEMQVFLDSGEEERFTKYRLGKLPGRAEEDMGTEDVGLVEIPDRKAKPFRPGEGVIHGYYQKSQPAEAVLAVLAEDIQGVEEQIAGLRLLARGLMERQIAAQGSKEVAQLADAHSRAAARLAELIDYERNREERKGDSQAEGLLEAVDQIAIALGKEPYSEEIRAQFLGEDGDLGLTNRRLVEEIAAVRYSLRRVLVLALESEGTAAYLHLVEIYGNGCLRLVRLLKREGRDDGRLGDYLQEMFVAAASEVWGDWQTGEPGLPLIWDRGVTPPVKTSGVNDWTPVGSFRDRYWGLGIGPRSVPPGTGIGYWVLVCRPDVFSQKTSRLSGVGILGDPSNGGEWRRAGVRGSQAPGTHAGAWVREKSLHSRFGPGRRRPRRPILVRIDRFAGVNDFAPGERRSFAPGKHRDFNYAQDACLPPLLSRRS